jgi:hypothetical protein
MRLQDLSTELLVFILASTSSLTDLGALASTSRRIYAVFQAQKAVLIYHALAAELGPVLCDALGFSHAEPLDTSLPSYHQQVREFLSVYEGCLSGQDRPPPRQPEFSLDYVLGLVNSYRLMSYLASVYTTSHLQAFQDRLNPFPSHPLCFSPPSRTEHLRILRAFYRVQLINNLWGHCASKRRSRSLEYSELETECFNYRLFGLWETWELQQVACVVSFLRQLRSRLAWLEDDDLSKEVVSERVFYRLGALRDLIEKLRAADGDAWAGTLKWCLAMVVPEKVPRPFALCDVHWLHPGAHSLRMRLFPHGKYSFPVDMRFDGDHATAVPFAWVDAFNGRYAHDYFGFVALPSPAIETQYPNCTHHPLGALWSRLGFVMWDAPRVMALKLAPGYLTNFGTGWTARAKTVEEVRTRASSSRYTR